MLKNFIIIENENYYQCDTVKDLVKKLIDNNYYNLTEEEKKNKMKMLAVANTINHKMKIVDKESFPQNYNIDEKFIIKDEITYILSLLITNNIFLLEKNDSKVFNKYIKYDETKDNYVIINKFAKELLQKYLKI